MVRGYEDGEGDSGDEKSVAKCNFMRGLRLLISYSMHA